MVELLHIPLLALHLICMNVACGAPLLCIWLEWRAQKSEFTAPAKAAADYLAAAGVISLLAGSLLGLVMGWLLWTPDYARIWTERLGHKMHWGAIELLFSLALLAGYWLWRTRSSASGTVGAIIKSSLLLFASTNLLYHFPPLFLIAGRLAKSAPAAGEVRGKLFVQEMLAGEIPALWVHFTLASVAMAGVMLLGRALRMHRRGVDPMVSGRVALWGGYWGLAASALQLPVGLWVLVTLPAAAHGRILGGLPMFFFMGGVAATLWLLRELVSIITGDAFRGSIVRAMGAMVVVVVLMSAALQLAR